MNGVIFGKGILFPLFLFIIVMQLLFRMIYETKELNLFHEVNVAKLAPLITHLLFADDLEVFYCGHKKKVKNVFHYLDLNYKWIRQCINF